VDVFVFESYLTTILSTFFNVSSTQPINVIASNE